MSSETKEKRPKSHYELVMVAAREARRLNERYSHRGLTPPKKVTSEAMERVEEGEVVYDYGDDEAQETQQSDEESHRLWNQ